MIRFIRLLFYHIYLYYFKVDKGNKAVAKFTTFLIFTLIFGINIYCGYVLLLVSYNDTLIVHTPYIIYIFLFIIVGGGVGKYIYSENLDRFDSFKDYHIKYYFYFFLLAGFTIILVFYSASINRSRIFKQRGIQKEYIQYKIGNDLKNGN